ncbi:MAG TPA: SDR family NAD(P)-dependent oxidoreductase [Candidatus Dormibacteraeota bacterium]|nr:SDR family NAD(P)-dependent oxidoreductase [Candidatus Dormibacteraeota bacterium]
MGLQGRVAVITGSGQGIGAGVARRLAADGARVVLNDVEEARVAEVAAALTSSGAQATYLVADIAQATGAEALIAHALERFGQLDILVNNAGIARDRWLVKMSDDDWDQVIAVNLRSQFLCSRAAARAMMERCYGRIINIASRAWLGGPGQANYSASKGGVVSLTRTLALELGKYQVTANAVAPGLVDTPLFRGLTEEVQARLVQSVPVGRIGGVDEVAGAVAFFADDASWYVTGQLLYVCGGRSVGAA